MTQRTLPAGVKLVQFDLDGTLIDSVGDLTRALNKLFEALGCAPLEEGQVRNMVGDGAGVLVQRALAARPDAKIEHADALARFMQLYEADPLAVTRPYDGVPVTLARLAAAGIPLAICTNKPERASRAIVECLGLSRYFAGIIGGDTLPWRKPDPRPLLHLIESRGLLPAETVFVGDSEIDAEAASAAGVPFVLMSYGYRRGPVESIAAAAALDDFAGLEALLLG